MMHSMAAIDETSPRAKPLRIGDVVETTQLRLAAVRGDRMQRWYAIHTGARCERRVQRWLEELGYPTIVLLYLWDGWRPRNLIPRYVFARFDVHAEYGDRWHEILEIDGVSSIVGGESPLAVPAGDLARAGMECLTGYHDRREIRKQRRTPRKPGTKNTAHRRIERRKARRASRILKQWLVKHQGGVG